MFLQTFNDCDTIEKFIGCLPSIAFSYEASTTGFDYADLTPAKLSSYLAGFLTPDNIGRKSLQNMWDSTCSKLVINGIMLVGVGENKTQVLYTFTEVTLVKPAREAHSTRYIMGWSKFTSGNSHVLKSEDTPKLGEVLLHNYSVDVRPYSLNFPLERVFNTPDIHKFIKAVGPDYLGTYLKPIKPTGPTAALSQLLKQGTIRATPDLNFWGVVSFWGPLFYTGDARFGLLTKAGHFPFNGCSTHKVNQAFLKNDVMSLLRSTGLVQGFRFSAAHKASLSQGEIPVEILAQMTRSRLHELVR